MSHGGGEVFIGEVDGHLDRRAGCRLDRAHVGRTVGKLAKPLDRGEMASAIGIFVVRAERRADQPRGEPRLGDDRGFGEPEDEIREARRVLGVGGQVLEQVDVVEGDDADQADRHRLFRRFAAQAGRDRAKDVEGRGGEQPLFRIDVARPFVAKAHFARAAARDMCRERPLNDVENRLSVRR